MFKKYILIILASSIITNLHGAARKKHRCPYDACGMSFARKGHLKSHELTHTGERPFVCTYPGCTSAFARKSTLKNHELRHTEERPFVCDHPGCGIGFKQISSLKRHESTHTGEKPFTCTHLDCGRAFARKSNLKSHFKFKHKAKAMGLAVAAPKKADPLDELMDLAAAVPEKLEDNMPMHGITNTELLDVPACWPSSDDESGCSQPYHKKRKTIGLSGDDINQESKVDHV